jgi:hypothetical protein
MEASMLVSVYALPTVAIVSVLGALLLGISLACVVAVVDQR